MKNINDMTEEEFQEALKEDPELRDKMKEELIKGMFEPEDEEQARKDEEILDLWEETLDKEKSRNGLCLAKG